MPTQPRFSFERMILLLLQVQLKILRTLRFEIVSPLFCCVCVGYSNKWHPPSFYVVVLLICGYAQNVLNY
jgi:hypothetical protein